MTTLPSLFDLSASARAVRTALDDADGDPDREAALGVSLALLEGDIAAKVDACATIMAELDAEEVALAEFARRMHGKALAAGRKRERMREYVATCLQAAGVEKVSGAHFTASLRRNPPHVTVTDETLLPPEYFRTKVVTSVDKVAVRDAIKGGTVVPGAAMVAGDIRLEVK